MKLGQIKGFGAALLLSALISPSVAVGGQTHCIVVSGIEFDPNGAFASSKIARKLATPSVFKSPCIVVESWSKIQDVIDELKAKKKLTSEDQLFFFQASHGSPGGEAVLSGGNETATFILDHLEHYAQEYRVGAVLESCYSGDLLQQKLTRDLNSWQSSTPAKHIRNLCLVTAAPFGRPNFGGPEEVSIFESSTGENLESLYLKKKIGLISSAAWSSVGLDRHFAFPEEDQENNTLASIQKINQFFRKSWPEIQRSDLAPLEKAGSAIYGYGLNNDSLALLRGLQAQAEVKTGNIYRKQFQERLRTRVSLNCKLNQTNSCLAGFCRHFLSWKPTYQLTAQEPFDFDYFPQSQLVEAISGFAAAKNKMKACLTRYQSKTAVLDALGSLVNQDPRSMVERPSAYAPQEEIWADPLRDAFWALTAQDRMKARNYSPSASFSEILEKEIASQSNTWPAQSGEVLAGQKSIFFGKNDTEGFTEDERDYGRYITSYDAMRAFNTLSLSMARPTDPLDQQRRQACREFKF